MNLVMPKEMVYTFCLQVVRCQALFVGHSLPGSLPIPSGQDLASLYSCFSYQILAISNNISRVFLLHGPRLFGGGERGHSGLLHALASVGKR